MSVYSADQQRSLQGKATRNQSFIKPFAKASKSILSLRSILLLVALSYSLQQAYAIEVAAESHTTTNTEIDKAAKEDIKRDQLANQTVEESKRQTLEIQQNMTKDNKANSSSVKEAIKQQVKEPEKKDGPESVKLLQLNQTGDAILEVPTPKKVNVQVDSQIEAQGGSQVQIEQKAELEVDPSHRNKVKQLEGVFNPLDETEDKIRASMDHSGNYDLYPDSGTNVLENSKRNFEKIFNQLQAGMGNVQDSHINEEIQKYGGNSKQMGAETHREATAPVRKEETKMGNLQNVQLDQGTHSKAKGQNNQSFALSAAQDDKDQIEVEKTDESVDIIPKTQHKAQKSTGIKQKKAPTNSKTPAPAKAAKPVVPAKKQAAVQKKPVKKQKKAASPVKTTAHPKTVSPTPAAQPSPMSDETNDLLKEANQAMLGLESPEKPKTPSLVQKNAKDKATGDKKKRNAASKNSSAASVPNKQSSASDGLKEDEQSKREACPACPAVSEQECAAANSQTPNLDQLLQKGNEFKVPLADDGQNALSQGASDQNSMSFYIMPKDSKNGVARDIQVLNSERIVGYNTYAGMMRGAAGSESSKDGLQDRAALMMNDDADYYNVTVNLVLKKGAPVTLESPAPPPQAPLPQAVVQIPVKETQLPISPEATPKDLARVELATESSSSYEAAASLDISNQESNKEIAESEHYQSRIAQQQASNMMQKDDRAPSDALQWQDQPPPADVNAQVTDNLLDYAGDRPALEYQSVLQLHNDVSLQPKSLADEQQLVQLHNSASQRNAQAKGKKMSADAFDEGDGSTHTDQDYDYDMAQASAAKAQQAQQQVSYQGLTQGKQQSEEQEQEQQQQASEQQQAADQQEAADLAEQQQQSEVDVAHNQEIQREQLQANKHKDWMKKLAQKGMAYADQNAAEKTEQVEEQPEEQKQPSKMFAQQRRPARPQQAEQDYSEPKVQQLSRSTSIKQMMHQRKEAEQLAERMGADVPNEIESEEQMQIKAQQLGQRAVVQDAPATQQELAETATRQGQQQAQEVSAFSEDEGAQKQQESQAAAEQPAKQEQPAEQLSEATGKGAETREAQEEPSSTERQDLTQQSSDKDSEQQESQESAPEPSANKNAPASTAYDRALREKEEKWSKEAEEAAHAAGADEEKSQGQQKHSRLVSESTKAVEPYEQSAEDKALDDEEQKLEEMAEEEKAAKKEAEKQAAIKAQQDALRKETERQNAIALEKKKLIAQIAAKQEAERAAKEEKLRVEREALKEKIRAEKQQEQKQEEERASMSRDQKLAKEQERIEQHIRKEMQLLDQIVQRRKKAGAMHLHQLRIVTEDLDQEANQEEQRQLLAKKAHEQEVKRKKAEETKALQEEQKRQQKKAMEQQREKQEVKELEEQIKMKQREVQEMAGHQKRRQAAIEHEKKHAAMLKKRSAMLSEEFEAEERRKRESREKQIRMLEASKRKLQEADSFDTKKELSEKKKKKEKKKKGTKWPKMQIEEKPGSKDQKPGEANPLISLHQKAAVPSAEKETNSKDTSASTAAAAPQKKQPVKQQARTAVINKQKAKKDKVEVKHEQAVPQKPKVEAPKPKANLSEEESSMKDTQDELKQIQKDLEDAQHQAERYQKEKEEEEAKQSKLIEQIRTQSEEVKKSEDIIKQAKMSLTVMDEDRQEVGLSKDEKDALDQVNKAKEQGEKNGAEAAKKMLQQAKGQTIEENSKQFEQLKDKLQSTSRQVLDIVQNFQRVHTDLQDLKEEYIQQKLQELDGQQEEDDSQVQISEQMHLSQETHSESLQNIQKSIQQKKGELQQLMTSFAQIKQELNQISQEKERIDQNQELVQLEQLRATLDETIDESERAGHDDLVQLDQTVGLQLSDSQQDDEEKVIVDVQNLLLGEDELDLEQDTDSLPLPLENSPLETNLVQMEEQLLRAQQSNNVIQQRLKGLLQQSDDLQ